MNALSFLGPLVKPIAGIFQQREARKRAVQTLQAKTAQAQQAGATEVALNDSEWELIGQRLQTESWKDEFVTVIVFAPFITSLIGALLAAFGYPELSQAAATMMASIAAMAIDYGTLLYITALAALGLRAIKR